MDELYRPLSSQVGGERPISEGNQRGPIAPSSTAASLRPARDRGVVGVPGRQGKLNENRPVPEDNTLSNLANILGQTSRIFGSVSTLVQPVNESDASLKGFVAELNSLVDARNSGSIKPEEFSVRARAAASSALAVDPNNITTIAKITQEIGGITLGNTQLDEDQINTDNLAGFLSETPQGRLAALRSRSEPNPREYLLSEFAKFQAFKAQNELAAATLAGLKDNDEINRFQQLKQIRPIADEMLTLVTESLQETMKEIKADDVIDLNDITSLREAREYFISGFTNQFIETGFLPEIYENEIARIIAPFDRAVKLFEEHTEDLNTLVNQNKYESVLKFQNILEQAGLEELADPSIFKTVMEAMVLNPETGALAAEYLEDVLGSIFSNTNRKIHPPTITQNSTASSTIFNPEYQEELAKPENKQMRSDLAVRSSFALRNINADNFEDTKNGGILHLNTLLRATDAGNQLYDLDTFMEHYVDNVDVINLLLNSDAESSEETAIALSKVMTNQISRALSLANRRLANAMPDGYGFTVDESGFSITFDPDAFLSSDKELNVTVKNLLKGNNLAATDENIQWVIDNPVAARRNLMRNYSNNPILIQELAPDLWEMLSQGNMNDQQNSFFDDIATAQTIWAFATEVEASSERFSKYLSKLIQGGDYSKLIAPGITPKEQEVISSLPNFNSEEEALADYAARGSTEREVVVINGVRYFLEPDDTEEVE